jgi:sulfite reductase alpha subunit-like flavoprotein
MSVLKGSAGPVRRRRGEALENAIRDAVLAIVAEQGGLSREGAEDYVRNLQSGHRYQRDVY